jgi:S1-C subfamily serine protease
MQSISALLVSFLLLLGPIVDGGWLGVYLAGDRDAAVVTEVIPGSPAAKAGVKAGDVILAVNDHLTPSREKLIEVIAAGSPGDRVTLKIERDGKEMTLEAKLGTRPETAVVAPVAPGAPAKGGVPSAPVHEHAPAREVAYLGVALVDSDAGVRIERVVPGTPAASAGVAAGEILQTFDGQPVAKEADVQRAIAKCKPGSKVEVGLKSQEGARSVVVTLGRRPADAEEEVMAEEVRPEPAPSKKVAPRRTAKKAPAEPNELEAEVESLRQELRDLRKQLEELRKQSGRE